MFNTCEKQTDRCCVDEQKESCNEGEFTCETKADLEKHTNKKKPAILCLHDGSLDDRSAPQLIKRPGCVLSCLYD